MIEKITYLSTHHVEQAQGQNVVDRLLHKLLIWRQTIKPNVDKENTKPRFSSVIAKTLTCKFSAGPWRGLPVQKILQTMSTLHLTSLTVHVKHFTE